MGSAGASRIGLALAGLADRLASSRIGLALAGLADKLASSLRRV
jgi:hypothetical protein